MYRAAMVPAGNAISMGIAITLDPVRAQGFAELAPIERSK